MNGREEKSLSQLTLEHAFLTIPRTKRSLVIFHDELIIISSKSHSHFSIIFLFTFAFCLVLGPGKMNHLIIHFTVHNERQVAPVYKRKYFSYGSSEPSSVFSPFSHYSFLLLVFLAGILVARNVKNFTMQTMLVTQEPKQAEEVFFFVSLIRVFVYLF